MDDERVNVTIAMAASGAAEYRAWEADERERAKLNAVANLVARVYASMEAERRRALWLFKERKAVK